MPDPIFAAEMAAVAAARRERERGRVGDGMAAGTDEEHPAMWMDFTGPRVPVPPSKEPAFTGWDRTFHRHSGKSECLESIAGGVRLVPKAKAEKMEVEVPEPGWVRCSHNGVRLHLHGEHLMAHFSGDRKACPNGVLA